ncbi:MAG: hypothetical protein LBK60_12120 [Verrucomicrobiales bacterium]|jgi:hypothetical protein|nr:hypothetical protein [Verrucomicrobiales bacterium]
MMRFVLAVLNLLGWPGLGSWLAGHKRAGLIQAILHLLATLLTVAGFCQTIHRLLPWLNPSAPLLRQFEGIPLRPLLIPLTVTCAGLIIFAANWLWSATTTKPK